MSLFTDMKQYYALQTTNKGYWFDLQGVLHGAKITWMPLPENATQPKIQPRSLILHSNAGSNAATFEQLHHFLNTPGQNGECHFDVDNSGRAGQFMSVLHRADCNFDANSWMYQGKLFGAIAIETGDNGWRTLDVTPWNFEQLDTIISIDTALAIQYDTGCNEVLKYDGKGVDFHTKFPWVAPGVKAWSNVRGKTCPGKARKLQLPYIRNEVAHRVAAYINLCQKLGVPHGIQGL